MSNKQQTNIWGKLLNLMGWKALYPESLLPKSVICVAPHTSNRDFFIGYLFYKSMGKGVRPKFLIKKELFFFPLNFIIKWLGGLAVNRKKGASTIEQAIALFKESDQLHLGVTPEGTRSYQDTWKTGFYRIALGAEVPIEIAKIDYGKKEVGIIGQVMPTGNMKEEVKQIRSYFTKEMARFPEKFAELTEE